MKHLFRLLLVLWVLTLTTSAQDQSINGALKLTATLNTNVSTSGTLGVSLAGVSRLKITPTANNLSVTLPTPPNADSGKLLIVENGSTSNTITVNGEVVEPGRYTQYIAGTLGGALQWRTFMSVLTATTNREGKNRIATNAEVAAGMDTVKTITSRQLRSQRGKLRTYTYAEILTMTSTYPDGASVENGDMVRITDGNRGLYRWNSATGSWVPENRKTFDLRDFGATQAGLQAAATAAGGGVLYLGDASVSVTLSLAITLPSNITVISDGATLTQTASNTPIFDASNKTKVLIFGTNFVGKGTDFINSPGMIAVGVLANDASKITIADCTFSNFATSSFKGRNFSSFIFRHNVVVGLGSPALTPVVSGANYGVAPEVNCTGVLIEGNEFSQLAQGVAIGDLSQHIRIIGNYIHDIVGQHGMYIDAGVRNILIANNVLTDIKLIGIKVQNYDDPMRLRNALNVSLVSNAIWKANDGIAVLSTTTNATQQFYNVSATGNIVLDVVQDAFSFRYVQGLTLTGNVGSGVGRDGLSFLDCKRVTAGVNQLFEIQQNGVRVDGPASDSVTLNGVEIYSPALGNIANNKFGVIVTGVGGATNHTFKNLIIRGSANMQYGLFVESGDQTTMVVKECDISGASEYAMRFKAAIQPLKFIGGNILSGTLGEILNLPTTAQRGNTGREFFGTAAPSSGAYLRNDILWNYTPSESGIAAWICTTAGSPGTWTPLYLNNQQLNTNSQPVFGATEIQVNSPANATVTYQTFKNLGAGYVSWAFKKFNENDFGLTQTINPLVPVLRWNYLSGGANVEIGVAGVGATQVNNVLKLGLNGPEWIKATGAPTGACVTGSLYSRTDGGAGSTLYVCEAAAWAAK